MPTSPRTTNEAAEFLRTTGNQWHGLCLKLQRTARGIPAVFPTANAAAHATPQEDRVNRGDLKRGMVAYFDNVGVSGDAGHIVFVAGVTSGGIRLCWSSDARVRGGVDLVSLSFPETHWNQKFLFGATSLNGWDLDLPDRPKPKVAELGKNYENAMKDLQKAITFHSIRKNDKLVGLLKKDLAVMKKRYERFGKD